MHSGIFALAVGDGASLRPLIEVDFNFLMDGLRLVFTLALVVFLGGLLGGFFALLAALVVVWFLAALLRAFGVRRCGFGASLARGGGDGAAAAAEGRKLDGLWDGCTR